jgi:signal transduction histidine kinase
VPNDSALSRLTREVGGSGLRLAICKGIIEGHGGNTMAESEIGEGSYVCDFVVKFHIASQHLSVNRKV